MVNGAGTVFIEVNGKIQRPASASADNQQLLNICQRIVSQVGRRVDESSPISTRASRRLARPTPSCRRWRSTAPPHHPQIQEGQAELDQLVKFGGSRLRARKFCRSSAAFAARADLRRHRLRQDDAAQLSDQLYRTRRAASSPARTPPNCSCSSRTWYGWKTRPPTSRARPGQMRELVRNCLRMRPQRIIVAKSATGAFDLLQAMNTGHDGSWAR